MKKILSKNLALIGFQACGKTTLGKRLALDFNCHFVDTDRLIEKAHPSLTCREIFQTFGAAYFRNLERQVLVSLNHQPPTILATGGGTLLQLGNGEILKHHSILIYLKTSADILKQRIWLRQSLPAYLNTKDPHLSFDQIYLERTAIYEKWADYILEMDHLNIEEAFHQLINTAKTI